jgi:hypothetical protein
MGEVHTGLWWGNLKRNHLEDLGVDGRIILKIEIQNNGMGPGMD